MHEKRFVVAMPPDKYAAAARLARANGMNMTTLVRSLIIRATMLPEQFGLVPATDEDFHPALVKRK